MLTLIPFRLKKVYAGKESANMEQTSDNIIKNLTTIANEQYKQVSNRPLSPLSLTLDLLYVA